MPDDPLNTDPPRNTPPAPTGRKFKCVFCDCVMTGDGESIWSMGERAKEFDAQKTRHAEVVEKKDKEIAKLTEQLADARNKIEALTSNPNSGSTHRVGKRVGA